MSNQKISELGKLLREAKVFASEKELRCNELNREVALWMEKEKIAREIQINQKNNHIFVEYRYESKLDQKDAEIKTLKWVIEQMVKAGKA